MPFQVGIFFKIFNLFNLEITNTGLLKVQTLSQKLFFFFKIRLSRQSGYFKLRGTEINIEYNGKQMK